MSSHDQCVQAYSLLLHVKLAGVDNAHFWIRARHSDLCEYASTTWLENRSVYPLGKMSARGNFTQR